MYVCGCICVCVCLCVCICLLRSSLALFLFFSLPLSLVLLHYTPIILFFFSSFFLFFFFSLFLFICRLSSMTALGYKLSAKSVKKRKFAPPLTENILLVSSMPILQGLKNHYFCIICSLLTYFIVILNTCRVAPIP